MPDSDITLGELSRNLKAMESRQNTRFTQIETSVDRQFLHVNQRLDSLQFVNQGVYDAQMSALTSRVDNLEEREKWRSRMAATALVMAFALPVLATLVVTR